MNPIIVFENLYKSYGSLKVLQDVSGSIHKGEVVSIIGSSGCGKSTLLRCFNHLEKINGGYLKVVNLNLSNSKIDHKELQKLRTKVSMVFQNFNLFPHLNVLQNLMLAPVKVSKYPVSKCKRKAILYLEKVGLVNKAYAYPEQLSGGQKQRVAIARSLCMNPEIILFDEPTSSLDPESVGEVLNVIQQLAKEGITMVIVTHEINFAREVSNRTIFLDQGQIKEQGIAYEVLTNPKTQRLQVFLSGTK